MEFEYVKSRWCSRGLALKGARNEAWLIFMDMVKKQLTLSQSQSSALFPSRTGSACGPCPLNDVSPPTTARPLTNKVPGVENYTWL
jgi:hypothetical protein